MSYVTPIISGIKLLAAGRLCGILGNVTQSITGGSQFGWLSALSRISHVAGIQLKFFGGLSLGYGTYTLTKSVFDCSEAKAVITGLAVGILGMTGSFGLI